MHSVYKITFPSNKVYVGCSSDPQFRLTQHMKNHVNKLLYREVEKHGWDHTSFEILGKFISREDALEKEKEVIGKYAKFNRSLNYADNKNLTHSEYSKIEVDDYGIDNRLVVEVDANLKERFKNKVDSEGRSMKWYINKWVREYTYDKKEVK